MEGSAKTIGEVEDEVLLLVEANRARCFWYAPEDFIPETDAERVRALEAIERHGDREAFVKARELRQWLLQHSSAR
jgi:hypothetical protein